MFAARGGSPSQSHSTTTRTPSTSRSRLAASRKTSLAKQAPSASRSSWPPLNPIPCPPSWAPRSTTSECCPDQPTENDPSCALRTWTVIWLTGGMLRAFGEILQRDAGCGEAAHPVDAAAGRGGGGAEVDPGERRAVRNARAHGAREKLPEVHRTAVDVSADEVAVVALELGRAPGAPGQDRLPETRREALDLRLDRLRIVLARAVRHVAVRPGGVLALGRAGGVEARVLCQEHERRRPLPAGPGRPLRGRELVERAAEVHRRGAADLGRAPRDGLRERPVQLEGTRPVAVAAERALVALGETAAPEPKQLAGRDVREHDVGLRELVDRVRRVHAHAVLLEPRDERVREPLRTPARKAPAEDVSEHEQGETEAGARSPLEREHRVRCLSSEERACLRGRERALRERSSRLERAQRRPRADGTRQARERPPSRRQRSDEHGLEQDGGAVVEGMCGLHVGVNPIDVEVERAEERRLRAEWVDSRADVVHVAGQGQLERADAAADGLLRLVDLDVEPCAGELERAGEAVRPRPDDDGSHRRLRSAGPSDCPPRSTGSERAPCWPSRAGASPNPK